MLDLEITERINQILIDQANRLNDGYAHTDNPAHQLYEDIEFLLGVKDPHYPSRYAEEVYEALYYMRDEMAAVRQELLDGYQTRAFQRVSKWQLPMDKKANNG